MSLWMCVSVCMRLVGEKVLSACVCVYLHVTHAHVYIDIKISIRARKVLCFRAKIFHISVLPFN